jgi:hypothetical protein
MNKWTDKAGKEGFWKKCLQRPKRASVEFLNYECNFS